MGVEPIMEALKAGAQVVLCGRCYDPAAFAAPAILAGYDKALAVHMGKILECAAIAATPGSGSDCMMGYLYEDSFAVEPCPGNRKCTVTSVSAHTLYEKSNPCFRRFKAYSLANAVSGNTDTLQGRNGARSAG
jgi:hypothetical protein